MVQKLFSRILSILKIKNKLALLLSLKKQIFLIFKDRYSLKIVGYDIFYDKSRETIQKIIDFSQRTKQYYFDVYVDFNSNY